MAVLAVSSPLISHYLCLHGTWWIPGLQMTVPIIHAVINLDVVCIESAHKLRMASKSEYQHPWF